MGNCNQIKVDNFIDNYDENLFKYDIPIKHGLPKFYRFSRPIYFQSKNRSFLRGKKTTSNEKVIIKKFSKIDENRIDLKGELDILLKLDNPNIIKCLEYFQTKSHYYIIYPYFNGMPVLDYFVKNPKDLNKKNINIFLKNILTTLRYLHENNIAHRLLDPSKILFDGKNVMLVGFGSARVIKKKKI